MNLRKGMKSLIVLTLIMVLLTSIPSNFAQAASLTTEEQDFEQFLDDLYYFGGVLKSIEEVYVYEITQEELMQGAMKGLFFYLDNYSNYYTPEEYEELNKHVTGEFGGIGINITDKDGYVTIVSPITGTPGDIAGLKAEDKIVSVDGVDISGYTSDQAVILMKGEPGTTVQLGILRGNSLEVKYFDITREIITINPVNYEILEDNIGLLEITEFNEHTLENVIIALNEFDNEKIDKVIVDVRNNPGGNLDEVINILRFLIPRGPIVHVKDGYGNVETYYSYIDAAKYELAVLVNEGSASASEIFAGAVQDSNTGIIIGTTTFGKGTVQSIIPLDEGGAIKLTVAEFSTPNDNPVNGVGITPDIIVENTYPELSVDLNEIPTFTKTRKPTLNTVGLDVLAAEQILKLLGYNVNEPDGVLDQTTFDAIKKFQADNGMSSYGVLDFATQDKLTEALIDYVYNLPIIDKQLEKAIEVLKN